MIKYKCYEIKKYRVLVLLCILGAARSASVFSVVKKPKIRVKKVSWLRGSGYEPDPATRSSQPAMSLILLLLHKTLQLVFKVWRNALDH